MIKKTIVASTTFLLGSSVLAYAASVPSPTIFPHGINKDTVIPNVLPNGNSLSLSEIGQKSVGSVQQTDANQPNGYPKLDANGNVTASLVTVSALYGTDVTAAPTDTDTALYTLTPSGPTTVTLGANGSAGHQKMVELLITQPASGGSVVTLAGTIFWPNSISPVISAVAGDKTFIRFMTVDGGKTYIGGI